MAIKLGDIFVALGLKSESFFKGLDDAKKAASEGGKEVGRKLSEGAKEAREAAELLGDTLGVHLPRALRNVLAHSKLVGPALSAAFNATVYAAFAKEAIELGQHTIPELVESFTHWKEKAEEVNKAQTALNHTVIQANEKIAQLQEQYRLIGLSGIPLANEKTIIAAEKFNKANEEVARLTEQLKKLGETSKQTTTSTLYSGSGVAGQVTSLTDAAARAAEQIPEVTNRLAEAQKAAQVAGQELKNAGMEIHTAFDTEQSAKIEAIRKSVDGFTQGLKDQIFTMTSNVIAINEYKAAQLGANEADLDAIKALSLKIQFLNLQKEGLKHPVTQHDEFGRPNAVPEVPQIPKEVEDSALRVAEYFERIKNAAAALPVLLKQPAKPLSDLQKITRRWAEDSSAALADWIVEGGSFREVLAGIIKDFAKMIIQMLIMKAIKRLFGGWLGLADGGIIPGRASGGPVFGGPFLVGERGPELFMPPASGGMVIPNNKLPDFSGGFGSRQTIYQIDARGAQAGVSWEIKRALQETEDRAVSRSVQTLHEMGTRVA